MIKAWCYLLLLASLLIGRDLTAQNFEFGYSAGVNFSMLNVVDSTAGVRDSVYGNSFEVIPSASPGYSFMAYGLYHLNDHVDFRFSTGADWISGKLSLGREGVGGNLSRTEDQYFEGWFHFAPGIQYSVELIPRMLGVSAGVDVAFGLAAINLLNELPKVDTVSVSRDYYRLTTINTFRNGYNIYVRPHAQLNFIRKNGRKWTVNVQYDQALLPYYSSRSTTLTYFDPNTLATVLNSGYTVEGRSSRWTVTVGAELPWGTGNKKRPSRGFWNF